MKYATDKVLFVADLAGTFVFAVGGATAAIRADLDLLGLTVLAFSTALAGGIFRDLLIGAVPPQALRDWRYPAIAFTGGAAAFLLYREMQVIPGMLLTTLDAAGLSLFAVAGTKKALNYNMHEFIAVLLGAVTGVGGGTVRDIFLAQVPSVLHADVYATAALAGSAAMILGRKAGLRPEWAAVLGGVLCFTLRMVSVWRHWSLPHVMNP
jgi:uncharacterized membrane protein YeiH